MTIFGNFYIDMLMFSVMATIAFREVLIILLPDRIVGPKGWLITLKQKL